MISDERLNEILGALCTDSLHDYEQVFDGIKHGEIGDMAKELLALRKAFSEPVAWVNQTDVDQLESHILAKRSKSLACTLPLYRKPTDSTT